MFQYGNSTVKFNCANDKDEEKNANSNTTVLEIILIKPFFLSNINKIFKNAMFQKSDSRFIALPLLLHLYIMS